jgi:8-amino-7-oxononanoate synthase
MLVELAEALGLEDDLPPELLQRSTTVGDLEASSLFAGAALRPAAPDPVGRTESHDEPGRPIDGDLVDLPGMRELEDRLGRAAEAGLSNPYFVLQEPLRAGLTRLDGALRTTFSGYDYLDLARHPDVVEASVRAVREWGTSASASRVAGGERPPHRDLERALADFLGVDSALTFTSGHATNVTVISTLVGPQDVVVHDALAHDSVVRGALLSGARRVPFRHGEPGDLDRVLTQVRHQHRRALVVIEGVYSMDGDVADLAAVSEVSRRHSALLMVDEAHSLGVLGPTGRGVAEHSGVDRGGADVWMGTLSKSLASCGGYVAGSRRLVEYLRYTAAGFVFSAGMPPASAAAARAALGVLAAEPERVLRLQQKADHFRTLVRDAGGDVGTSGGSAIVPVIVGDSDGALRLAASLAASGIDVQPIVSPAVDEDEARLRFFVTHGHDDDQLERAAGALRSALSRTTESAGRP